VLGDLAAGTLAMAAALWLWGRLDYLGPTLEFVRARAPWFVFLPVAWVLLLVNLYDHRRSASWGQTVRGVVTTAVMAFAVYLLLFFLTTGGTLPRRGLAYFLVLAIILTLFWRGLYIRVFTAPAFMRRVLIVGAGESGRTLLAAIKSLRPPPFHIVGLIDDDESKRGRDIAGFRVVGNNRDLLSVIERESVTDIIVAILGPMSGEMFQALLDAQQRGIEITRMPVTYEELFDRVPIRHLESDWLLRSFVDELRVSTLYLIVKRALDLLGAVVGLLLLAVVFPWVALAIAAESGRPILIVQKRLGQGGRVYDILKFRTMRKDAEADGQPVWSQDGDPRTTRVGRILRRAHLDEFPQFWSVLKGDMSIVGPRPERPELVTELEKQVPFYRARLLVKPGLTGWAQVNYGKGASFSGSAEKLEYDLFYIKHRGLVMDMSIILRTTGPVLGLRGE
jgi:exopolysaccharide biosynthesis polyprenyl glycosylphosphotransferase